MAHVSSLQIGKQLCDILGLDSNKVTSISIHVNPDSVVYVDVTQLVYEKEMSEVINLLKCYTLMESDTTPEIVGDGTIKPFTT